MPLDVGLIVDPGTVWVADGNSEHIEVDGSGFMIACIKWGAMSGSSTTDDVRVMVSTDEGANYYMRGKFQQVGPTNDDLLLKVPFYCPKPDTSGEKARVRFNHDLGGSSPSYAVSLAWVEPMLSLAPQAGEDTGHQPNATPTGIAAEVAAV